MNEAFVVDIGNTAIKSALFQNGDIKDSLRISHSELGLLQSFLAKAPTLPLITCSTASEELEIPAAWLQDRRVIRLDEHTAIPITLDYERKDLGLDRLANAIAGNALNPSASLVIDAGTCITYDYTVEGVYLGGNISPGWEMRLKAMHSFTGRLPLLEKGDEVTYRGKNTRQAMQAGAQRGILLEIDGIITEFKTRYPQGKVYLTGGDAPFLAERIENVIFATPFLTLKGLYEILLHTI